MNLTTSRSTFHILGVLALLALVSSCATPRNSQRGPWDLRALTRPPQATWGHTTGLVQELFYEGEPVQGKPTRVFAYLGRPAQPATRPFPAMVLAHGGGGKAFHAWAEHWARRGYVALAMDLAGHGPQGRLPDGGPEQSDLVKFRNFTEAEARDMWTYHAVAAVVRGHSLLRSLPDVDSDRIGITGISWGGYLTCIAAGIDQRFKVAVPVYGCGFLGDNSRWKDTSLAAMTPEARALWLRLFDPSQYLPGVRCPTLFVNGTTDFAYPLDSYQASYRLLPDRLRHVSVKVNRPHDHIWTFPEVDTFVDSVLKNAVPLMDVSLPRGQQGIFRVELSPPPTTQTVSLCYTTNTGPWQKRQWFTAPARVAGGVASASLPTTRPLVAFMSVDDARGHVSSEHIEFQEH